MANRVSALTGYYHPGIYGVADDIELQFTEVKINSLSQVTGWTHSLHLVAREIANSVGLEYAPPPNKIVRAGGATIIRIELLKWLILEATPPQVDAENGGNLDLTHARTLIKVAGPEVNTFLARLFSIDFRENQFKVGDLASTVCDHVPVNIWRLETSYAILIPRSYALSLWQLFLETATQFNHEVCERVIPLWAQNEILNEISE